ncbi:MAG: crotonase/enoyl-CoA hydratase family protein [Paracoccaceae bacterium]
MSEGIHIAADARGVVTVTLARTDKRNALSGGMIAAFHDFARTTGQDPATRAVILAAEGESFCAGGDLAWMQAQIAADRATRIAEATKLAAMFQALNTMPAPLIARVQGDAFGGGIGLIAVADTAIAADSARFGLTETRLGLIPATISPYVLARMGEGKARRVIMSARLFGAAEAVALDIVARTVPPAELDAAVEAEIEPYLAAAPGAVARAKALARSLGPRIDETVIADTIRRLADAWETEEAKEGIAAFFGKRKPVWRA